MRIEGEEEARGMANRAYEGSKKCDFLLSLSTKQNSWELVSSSSVQSSEMRVFEVTVSLALSFSSRPAPNLTMPKLIKPTTDYKNNEIKNI